MFTAEAVPSANTEEGNSFSTDNSDVHPQHRSTNSMKVKNLFKITGPSGKISALTVWNDTLYAIYDNQKELRAWHLPTGDIKVYKLPGHTKEWEGITFQQVEGRLYVYMCIDSPAEIWRFEFNTDHGFVPC